MKQNEYDPKREDADEFIDRRLAEVEKLWDPGLEHKIINRGHASLASWGIATLIMLIILLIDNKDGTFYALVWIGPIITAVLAEFLWCRHIRRCFKWLKKTRGHSYH